MTGLKKVLIYIAAVAGLIVAVDLVIDYSMRRYVRNHEMPGDYRTLDYLLKDFDDDALILGSSVALNSLNPVTIGDSLGLTVHNGASNGQAFTYQLVLLKSVLKNHTPKAVLLGIKAYDLSTEGAGARINFLSPYYGLGYTSIDSVLSEQSNMPKVLSRSSLLRYNTIWFRILLYHFIEPGVKGEKGFIAKDIPAIFPTKDEVALENMDMSDQRRNELNEIISICKANDIKLILFFPPLYSTFDQDLYETPLYKEVKETTEGNGMTLYDDTSHPAILADSTLFYDNSHLNKNGAVEYTNIFINRIKNDSILSK